MAIWLTADTHFGHENIIAYAARPYTKLAQMDYDMMRRWNETVADDDVVYHLGDFAMGDPARWPTYRAALRGRIILVRGNHDRHLDHVIDAMGLEAVVENAVLEIDGVRCWLNHYPPTPSHRGVVKRPKAPSPYDLALCGHVHNAWRTYAGVVNVGVDVWEFRPISVTEALLARA